MLLLLTSEVVAEDMVVEFQNGILQMLRTFSSSASGLTLPKPPAIAFINASIFWQPALIH